MKIGKNNKLLQKILMVMLTTLILFNFIMPTVVRATDDEEEIGGGLFTPIQYLLVGLGDSIMKLMQITLTGSNSVTTIVTPKDSDDVWWLQEGEMDWENGVNWSLINGNEKKAKVEVPTIEISPESIFSGKIPAFDINFFSPSEDRLYENGHWEYGEGEITYMTQSSSGFPFVSDGVESPDVILERHGWTKDENGRITQHENGKHTRYKESEDGLFTDTYVDDYQWEDSEGKEWCLKKYTKTENYIAQGTSTTTISYEYGEKKWVVDESGYKESIARQLRDTIAYWYNALRNIAIIGLLSVLVYIGIRIVLSSAAADKSKYKEMLKDWVVAICLLFFMHYFMNFTVTIIDSVTKALTINVATEQTEEELHTEDTTGIKYVGDQLIGDVRIKLQTGDASQRMAYTIIYIVLIIYTFIFAIMYFKRVLYMAFFTMMAPLVALTYPLDKIRDGNAQAFNMWMKEYTFNALIQPFHLIIYYVLVSSAIELATENPLYALVAIGFMIPAEKLLRKFFGFNKSETSGVLGGALGGAMIMQGISALQKRAGGSGGKKSVSGSNNTGEVNKAVRTADSGNNMNKVLNDIVEEDKGNISTANANSSNTIPYGDSDYSAQQERLDELTAEGFEKGDPEWDRAKAELDRYKLGIKSVEDEQEGQSDISDVDEEDELPKDRKDSDVSDKEETHRLRAAMSMAGRWTLKGAKLAAKGAGAVTLGTVGVAAGLASDDYSNVFKYGAAGAAAGGLAVGAAINKVPSAAYRAKQAYEQERARFEQEAYSGAERKRRANLRADEAFMRDKETIRLYKDKFGNEYRQAMEDAKAYRAYGITDNDTIIKAMKLESKGLPKDRKDNRRILMAGAAPTMNKKEVDDYVQRLRARGFTEKAAENMKRAISDFNDWA